MISSIEPGARGRETHWNAQVNVPHEVLEAGTQYAGNGVRFAVKYERLPEYAWITRESLSPKAIRKNCGPVGASPVLFCAERPAENRCGSDEREERRRGTSRSYDFGYAAAREVEVSRVVSSHFIEAMVLLLPLEVIHP